MSKELIIQKRSVVPVKIQALVLLATGLIVTALIDIWSPEAGIFNVSLSCMTVIAVSLTIDRFVSSFTIFDWTRNFSCQKKATE